jgi:hypothetical protein
MPPTRRIELHNQLFYEKEGGGTGGVKNLWQIELSELRCSWVRTSKKNCEENVAQQNTDFAFRDDSVHTREHRSCGEGLSRVHLQTGRAEWQAGGHRSSGDTVSM